MIHSITPLIAIYPAQATSHGRALHGQLTRRSSPSRCYGHRSRVPAFRPGNIPEEPLTGALKAKTADGIDLRPKNTSRRERDYMRQVAAHGVY
jgi:hypothetical protein